MKYVCRDTHCTETTANSAQIIATYHDFIECINDANQRPLIVVIVVIDEQVWRKGAALDVPLPGSLDKFMHYAHPSYLP